MQSGTPHSTRSRLPALRYALLWPLCVGGVHGAESQLLAPPSSFPVRDFGYAVAVDAGRVAVGAPGENDSTGAVYLYDCESTGCSTPIRLISPDPDDRSSFGAALALLGDTLVVGSPERDHGEVDVFRRIAGQWVHEENLTAFDGSGDARFGASLALSSDRLLIGAPRTNSRRGAAYAFSRNEQGWSQAQRLIDPSGGATDQYGTAVAMSGNFAWVGAPFHDADGSGPAVANGRVLTYEMVTGSWVARGALMPEAGGEGSLFGFSLSMQDAFGVVGAPGASQRAGSAIVMQRDGSSWSAVQTLGALPTAAGSRFGWAVGSMDETIVVGAPFAAASVAAQCGALYRFGRPAGAWVGSTDSPRRSELGSLLGWSVAIDGAVLFGAAPAHSGTGRALRFDPDITIFVDGYEGGQPGCLLPAPD